MDNLFFGLVLFTAIYAGLCRIVFSLDRFQDTKLVSKEDLSIEPEVPINLTGLADSIETEESEIVTDLTGLVNEISPQEAAPPIGNLLTSLNKFNVQTVRRIASKLKIKQTIKGKRQRKKMLVEQIKNRLKSNPVEVAAIIHKLNAA